MIPTSHFVFEISRISTRCTFYVLDVYFQTSFNQEDWPHEYPLYIDRNDGTGPRLVDTYRRKEDAIYFAKKYATS